MSNDVNPDMHSNRRQTLFAGVCAMALVASAAPAAPKPVVDADRPAVQVALPAPFPLVASPPEPMGFIADSPLAADQLRRVDEQVRAGNIEPAAITLRQLLFEQPLALTPRTDDPDLHEPVRAHAKRLLARSPALLRRVTDLSAGEVGKLDAAEGGDPISRFESLQRSWYFTPSGQVAMVELAANHVRAGRFAAASLVLAELAALPAPADGRPAGLVERAQAVGQEVRAAEAALRRQVGLADSGIFAPLGGQSALDPQPALASEALAPVALGQVRIDSKSAEQPDGASARRSGTLDVLRKGLDQPEFGIRPGVPGGPGMPRFWRGMNGSEGYEPSSGLNRTFPLQVGPTIFAASSRIVTAADWPRLTLRWQIDVLEAIGLDAQLRERGNNLRFNPSRSNPLTEEISTLTFFPKRSEVEGEPAGILLMVASFEDAANSSPLQIIVALDAQSGRLRWATLIDQLEKSLDVGATVRGPIIASGDTAVLTVRKYQPERRLGSSLLLGLDAWTGKLRWSAPMSSAGIPAMARSASATEFSAYADGVVYAASKQGAVAAYAAHDGQALWVRRVTSEPSEPGPATRPFMASGPLVTSDLVISLAADRRKLRLTERATGADAGIIPAAWLESPLYVLQAGERMACVGERTIAVVDLGNLRELAAAAKVDAMRPPAGAIRTMGLTTPRGGWARVSVAGDQLLVPEVTGISIIDLATMQSRQVPLDVSGNVMSTGQGLLITSDWGMLSSVLTSEGATSVLRTAMRDEAAGSSDLNASSGAALRLAQLAVRMGRPELLAEAGEGLTARAMVPENLDRQDVFGMTLRAVLDGAAGATGQRLAAVLSRLGIGPTEQAAVRLAEAELLLRSSKPGEAFAASQQVAGAQELAAAVFSDGTASLGIADTAAGVQRRALAAMTDADRVELDARGRVEFEAASAPQAAGGADAAAQQAALVRVAKRYAGTSTAVDALSGAAAEAERAGRVQQARRTRFDALQTAAAMVTAGGAPSEYAQAQRAQARDKVAIIAAKLRQDLASARLDVASQQVDQLVASAQTPSAAAAPQRAGGLRLASGGVQVLAGWAMVEPISGQRASGVDRAELLARHEDGRLGLFAAEKGGEFVLRWSVSDFDLSEILFADELRIVGMDRRDGSCFAFVRSSGEMAWRTPAFAEVVPAAEPLADAAAAGPGAGPGAADGAAGAAAGMTRAEINTLVTKRSLTPAVRWSPAGQPSGPRANEELLAACDGGLLVVAQRSGAVMAVEVATGKVVLRERLSGVRRIVDLATSAGALCILTSGNDATARVLMRAGIDQPARTVVMPSSVGAPRALRPTPWGEFLACGEHGAIMLVPDQQEPVWQLSDPRLSVSEVWCVGNSVVMMDVERRIWLADAQYGVMHSGPALRGASLAAGPVRIASAGANISLASTAGLALISSSGKLIGMDALEAAGTLLPPVRVQATAVNDADAGNSASTLSGFIAISTVPQRLQGDMLVIQVSALESRSARAVWSGSLLVGQIPHRAAAVGDRLALTAGSTTVLYRTRLTP